MQAACPKRSCSVSAQIILKYEISRKVPQENLIVLSDELFRISRPWTRDRIVALIRIPQPTEGRPIAACCLKISGSAIWFHPAIRRCSRNRTIHLSPGLRCLVAQGAQAGMGAHFHLSIHENSDLAAAAQKFPDKWLQRLGAKDAV